jgi:hypothetical protein
MTDQKHLYEDLCDLHNRLNTLMGRVDPLAQPDLMGRLYDMEHCLDLALDTFPAVFGE